MRHKHDFRRTSRDRRNSKPTARRGSSTSLDSHFGARLLNALTNPPDGKSSAPNLKRRAGNAGLDSQHINSLLSNGKLVIPYNVRSASEDENVSVTISESRYSVVLNNHNLDLNDQLVMKSLRQGLHIDSSTDSEDNLKDHEQEKRESRNSRRSRRSRRSRVKYSSNSESCGDSSSCPELKQLMQVE